MVTVSTYIHRRMRTGRTHGMSLSSLIRRWKVIECGAQPSLPCWSAPTAAPECREMLILYWRNISIMHYFVLLATLFCSNIWGNIGTHKCYRISSLPLHTWKICDDTDPSTAGYPGHRLICVLYCFDFWWFQWDCWLCIWPRRLSLDCEWILNKVNLLW